MKQSKFVRLCLCLILSIANAPWALAEGENDLKSLRARVVNPLRPIGLIESIGALTIDGRVAKGQELLRGSELIQAPDNASARLSLNAIGQASLNPSSVVFALTGAAPESIGSWRAGTLSGASVSVTTNAQGIASVSFTANSAVGSVPISASVAGASTAFTGTIYVVAGAAFWTTATTLTVIFPKIEMSKAEFFCKSA